MPKKFVLAVILVFMVSSLIMIKSVNGVPIPTVPEFTVEIIDASYDVPPASSVDKYTGETVTTPGRHVEAYHIEVSIKNQPFTNVSNSITYYLSYNIRVKGHFEEGWTELYAPPSGEFFHYPYQSKSGYTNISISGQYPYDAKVDFQVEAILSHHSTVLTPKFPMLWPQYANATVETDVIVIDETSGWSPTQTVTIPNSSPISTSQQGGTQGSLPLGLDWVKFIILFLTVMVGFLLVGIILLRKKCFRFFASIA